jgi:tRNA uridine 5-carboxymethylaminomethyl modification enzyme
MLAALDPDRPTLRPDIREQVEISVKYEGYILRQLKQVAQFQRLERKKLPQGMDYAAVGSLSMEARQKLNRFQPESVGQASRITGVSPADLSVLLVWLAKNAPPDGEGP